ncbi:MAG: PAC2 family protein [Actinobacteria bacterium]|uniref:Unannotated protein n=1 Tax=freshwater metagenome TaxID=449393 RepID=A0A6J6NNR4_9ZZZZ|nr:PAC2 family protein [Actinomycetota bacterium]
MSEELRLDHRPELRRPILICAFKGWNDGGQGASLAASFLQRTWAAEHFADIDPEAFFDFTQTRPQVSLVDGLTRRIDWPSNSFYEARLPYGDRDVILLLGSEPSLRWRTFCEIVTDLAKDLGVELVISLGSLLADVPHTRPAPVTGTGSDAELIEKLGLEASRYEGPTGIVGVLHDACRNAGLQSASLWAAVPHYVSLTPSPRAAHALVTRLAEIIDVPIDTTELDEAGASYVAQVTDAVEADSDTALYVDDLERRTDVEHEGDLPTGDALAAELAQFLREREEADGEDPPVARDSQ